MTSTTASFGRTGKQVEAVNYAQTVRRNEATERASSKRTECAEGARGGQHAKTALRYLVAAMACALFALIYAQFSHGVHSPFMTFMFAIPLLGGALPALVGHLGKMGETPTVTRQAWALALAALTVGSCLQGVFDIAGTDSAFIIAYPIAAVAFAAVAFAAAVRARR